MHRAHPQTFPQTAAFGRPRRVLISGGLTPGGTQTHVALLCRLLRNAGVDVTIAAASSRWSREALDQLRGLGVRIVVSPFGYGRWQTLGKAWAVLTWPLLLRRDFDVLYCIGEGRMHFFARRFLRDGGFSIYHEIVDCTPEAWTGTPLPAVVDGIVANSSRIAGLMAGRFSGVPVRSIPFCTSSAPMPVPSPRPAAGARQLRIAYLGRLAPHKHPAELIEIFARVSAQAPVAPARLDLYGGDYDGLGPGLQKRIRELGVEKSIALRGAYAGDEIGRILAETDLVVLPSRYEGLPLVLVEAMQRGIPVVATSAGGSAELGEDNPDVIITPGISLPAFETGLEEMASRLRAGQIDGPRLHAWTEARYGFEPVAAAWLDVLLSPEAFFTAPAAAEVRA